MSVAIYANGSHGHLSPLRIQLFQATLGVHVFSPCVFSRPLLFSKRGQRTSRGRIYVLVDAWRAGSEGPWAEFPCLSVNFGSICLSLEHLPSCRTQSFIFKQTKSCKQGRVLECIVSPCPKESVEKSVRYVFPKAVSFQGHQCRQRVQDAGVWSSTSLIQAGPLDVTLASFKYFKNTLVIFCHKVQGSLIYVMLLQYYFKKRNKGGGQRNLNAHQKMIN